MQEKEAIDDNNAADLLKEAFTQYWLHGRHVEYERFWMLQLYVAITVGLLTVKITDSFLSTIFQGIGASASLILSLAALHFLYSLYSLFASIKLSASYSNHNFWANAILKEAGLEKWVLRPIMTYVPGKAFFLQHFLSFNRIISQIYVLFMSVDAFLITESLCRVWKLLAPCRSWLPWLAFVLVFVIFFALSAKLKRKLEGQVPRPQSE